MELQSLSRVLVGLGIKSIRYFDLIGSTNAEALQWAEAGAPDLSLVVADKQTRGRGRAGRQWFTPARSALAFSLVLRFPAAIETMPLVARLAGLGALAVSDVLLDHKVAVQIKWPNDVLIQRRKVAGVLVEACWQADRLTAAVLGIGVNVTPQAVPVAQELMYPATSLEAETGQKVERLQLLQAILSHLLKRKDSLYSDQFLEDWSERLAFRGEWVQIQDQGKNIEGQVNGINEDGSLKLLTRTGQVISIYTGDVRLRPAI
jgi:BirA family transcriptional regulator, biotin operon repressor / biotin---[acetyl-CoA-carboxylase] ligase